MEAISYVNIFETKGLEYLLVITFLVSFFFFARFVCVTGKKAAVVSIGAAGELVEANFSCAADFECPYRRVVAEEVEEDIAMAAGGTA